jgi:HK97 family phage prohead protease
MVMGGAVIEGYASLFGRLDRGRDRVMPGAFRASLARRGAGGVRLLWQHDPGEPIGRWLDVREDARGLFVRGVLVPEVKRGREAMALLSAGALDGLSIGFRTVKARRVGGARELVEVDLWEISIVTFPLLDGARAAVRPAVGPPGEAGAPALAEKLIRAAEGMRL